MESSIIALARVVCEDIMAIKDLTGLKFGKLTVICRGEHKQGRATWTCQCECGNTKDVITDKLNSGREKSCGCSNYKTYLKVDGEITQELLKEIFHYDEESGNLIYKVSLYKKNMVGKVAGRLGSLGYVAINLNGKLYRAHRLIWMYVYGYFPPNHIDHINLIKHDNRLINLREATACENATNKEKQKNNKSGYKGVHWNKSTKKWVSQCKTNGIRHCLGSFDSAELAYNAYREFVRKNCGEFHRELC